MKLLTKVAGVKQVVDHMGLKYVGYRTLHALRTRMGYLTRRHPISPSLSPGISRQAFIENLPPYFFNTSDRPDKKPSQSLRQQAKDLVEGRLTYFSHHVLKFETGKSWLKHPITNQTYPLCHWSEIADLDPNQGDIKYIWEPSRFSFLYLLWRDDFHNDVDHAELIFSLIEDWIDNNPINAGPNYKCSQEISLRVLNWTWAIYYYHTNAALTEIRWQKIQQVVYWSLHHVYHHINFSRIAVRNNHAIAEALFVWAGSLLFPWLPHVEAWGAKGLKWLEQELAYQVYSDGTYIQHSHNYQRVLVQLLTYTLRLADLNNVPLQPSTVDRASSTLRYLLTVMQADGRLPNYGANDGALFFPLAEQEYRDFRPQLDALHVALTGLALENYSYEEAKWFGKPKAALVDSKVAAHPQPAAFAKGGIYTQRIGDIFVFIKAQAYADRPSQADNLHLDLWCGADNVLRDQGSYLYNTDPQLQKYFFGSGSHNTVMLGAEDSMYKASRFIFYNWTRKADGEWLSPTEWKGFAKGFAHVDDKIVHHRHLQVDVDRKLITIHDRVEYKPQQMPLRQLWHPHPNWLTKLKFNSVTSSGVQLKPITEQCWYSSSYGEKSRATAVIFESLESEISTQISWA